MRAGVAVVTGAGSGLGRALAIGLTRAGMRVVGFGRRAGPLAQTAKQSEIGKFSAMVVDVSDANSVAQAFETIANDIGPVTILINNAAVFPRRDFLDETPETFMDSVAINLGGVVACTDAALGQMTKTGVGRIMTVSTFADVAPVSGSAAYSVSKGAVRVFNRALIADIADRLPDIVVNEWMPGMLATEMGIKDGLDPAISAKWGAKLALWHDPALTGSVFERDVEVLPPRSLKRRLVDMLLLRKPKPARYLGGA